LTINGTISADGFGGHFWPMPHDNQIRQSMESPLPVTDVRPFGYGFSCTHSLYSRLQQYGAVGGFTNGTFFTPGPGGAYEIRWGDNIKRLHQYGLSTAGQVPLAEQSVFFGAGGGFIALYYNTLIIDGKIYGRDADCDVSKIHANGFRRPWNTYCGPSGGGCIVICANTINIGSTGCISADAIPTEISGMPYDPTISGRRLSYLNNFPQLAYSQEGYIWDPNLGMYVYDTTITEAHRTGTAGDSFYDTNTYYYSTGVDEACTQTATGDIYPDGGGAGVVLGYKLNENTV
jgi:hypothetical protein